MNKVYVGGMEMKKMEQEQSDFPMTLTGQIETLFTKHDHRYGSKEAWRAALIDDLVVLWPRPSRVMLKELLRQFHNDQLSMTEQDWLQKWLDLFMAWATQSVPPKTWCPDWTWDMQDQLWFPTNPQHENHWNPDYRFCEWCGAKRPKEER